jgi:hypothetical protein
MVAAGGIPRAHLVDILSRDAPYRAAMELTLDNSDIGVCRELARLMRHDEVVKTRCNQLRKDEATPLLVRQALEEMRKLPEGGMTLDWPLDNLSAWTLCHGHLLWTFVRAIEWTPPPTAAST